MKTISKKVGIIVLVVLMVLSLFAGCQRMSNGSDSNTPANVTEGDGDSAGSTDEKQYVVKFAHDYTTNSPYHEAAVEFKRILEEKTNSRMIVEIYPAQQLGSAREMIEGMQMGTIEMVWTPTAKFAGFDQKLTLLDLPYLFPNEDIMWEALEGEIGQELMKGLDKIGLKGISFNAEGYKQFTANKPIRTMEDLKGMKIRTMEAPVIMDMFKLWGANPVPIDFAEVYNSLQQKVVDGQENPIISNHDMKFYEVQKYITDSEHAYLTYFLSASNSWFISLPDDLQEAVMESGREMAQIHKEMTNKANEGYMQNMIDSGIEHYVMPQEARDELREAAMPLYDQYRDLIGGELIDKTLKFGQDRIN